MDSSSDAAPAPAPKKTPAPVKKSPATGTAAKQGVASDAASTKVGAQGKPAAKKAAPKRATAKKAAPKKAEQKKATSSPKPAAKKATPKKAEPKKATSSPKPAAKQATPKKAAPKKAAPKKVATSSKPAAKQAAPKKATPKKAASKSVAPLSVNPKVESLEPTDRVGPVGAPAPAPLAATAPGESEPRPEASVEVPASKRSAREPGPTVGQMAMVFSVTEEMLNDLLPFLVADGIAVEPMDTTVSLPGMGDVAVRLGLTVTGVRADLDPAHGGRIKVIVSADGEVGTRTIDFEGDTLGSVGAPGIMLPNARIPVVGEALVQPFIELRESGRITIGIDLATAEFVSIRSNQDAPAPEGIDVAAWPGMLAMFGVLLGGIGEDLFTALSEHVGDAMVELDEEIGSVFVELGGRPGPLGISVASGLVTIGLPAGPAVRGNALPVPIAGKRVGLGLASSVVDNFAQIALVRAAGDKALPFELELVLEEQAVGSRLRNTRVFPDFLPDLRGALRTEVRTRLLRGQLELSVQSAWLEMPSIVPSFVNQISRRIGGLVALAPFKVRFPAIIQAPLPEDAGTLPVKLDDLRVTGDGVGLVASLA